MIGVGKMIKRTKQETIEYFKFLEREFYKKFVRSEDEKEKIEALAKSEAYGLAAFEIERNMEG